MEKYICLERKTVLVTGSVGFIGASFVIDLFKSCNK